jgi:hypothetical protein
VKRMIFPLLIGFCLPIFLVFISRSSPTQAGSSPPFTVELLSNHSQTIEDAFLFVTSYGLELSGNIAHFYWQEKGNGSEGSNFFYRQLPGGTTIRLSDPNESEGDVVFYMFDTAVAPDGTFHIVWVEETGTAEGTDLFYWSATTGTLLLTDRTQTEGYVWPLTNTINIHLDNAGNPHVIWIEDTGTDEGRDMFYWGLASGTRLLTDRSQTEGDEYSFGPTSIILGSNTAHVTWAEVGNDGSTINYFYWNSTLLTPIVLPGIQNMIVINNVAHIAWLADWEGPINYWNSATKSVQAIPESTDNLGGTVTLRSWFVDSTDTAYLFWVKELAGVCLATWDTSSQTSTTLAPGGECYPNYAIYKDDSDTFHTVLVDQISGQRRYRYWNSSLAQPIVILETAVPINFGTLTGLSGTSEVHFTWTSGDGINENYYNWNNINQTITNLSQLSGGNTRIGSMGRYVQQSDGELFVLWSEQLVENGDYENFFWRSGTNTPVNLFTQLDIGTVSTSFEPMKLAFLGNGAPYTTWHGMLNGEPEGIYIWNSAEEMVHLAGESLPCSASGRSYSHDTDADDGLFVVWQDETTRTNYFWNEADGLIDLSQTAAAETSCLPPRVAVSDTGYIFAMWIEVSDVAGEGFDFYGAWIEGEPPPPSTQMLYLPMITR